MIDPWSKTCYPVWHVFLTLFCSKKDPHFEKKHRYLGKSEKMSVSCFVSSSCILLWLIFLWGFKIMNLSCFSSLVVKSFDLSPKKLRSLIFTIPSHILWCVSDFQLSPSWCSYPDNPVFSSLFTFFRLGPLLSKSFIISRLFLFQLNHVI